MNTSVSPSRTYVAVCNKSNFSGYYFRKFVLPERDQWFGQDNGEIANNSENASWYFLNRLNFVACIDGCIAFEDYTDIKDDPHQ